MSKALSTLLALGFLTSSALACGGERTERGLAPAEEPAVPESASALDETEAERRAGALAEEQARERELFQKAQEAARGGADTAMGGVGEEQMEAVEREEKLVDEELSEEEQKD